MAHCAPESFSDRVVVIPSSLHYSKSCHALMALMTALNPQLMDLDKSASKH
jgi:hypothetical protein